MSQQQPHETFAAAKPRKGDTVHYMGELVGTVGRVEDALCFVVPSAEKPEGYDSGRAPFIWCFNIGLNTMHDWPTKNGALFEELLATAQEFHRLSTINGFNAPIDQRVRHLLDRVTATQLTADATARAA